MIGQRMLIIQTFEWKPKARDTASVLIAWTHVCLMSLPQVVCEVLLDVLDEVVRVFRVEVQHLIQPLQVDTLQVTVGQGFHVRIGFYHSVI